MTTTSDPSSVKDELDQLRALNIDGRPNRQGTAAQGAIQALAGQGKDRPSSAIYGSTNGARVESRSAGAASTQASVSPWKSTNPAVSSPSPPRLPQVQQLVNDFERTSISEASRAARMPSAISGRALSRSPSRAAAQAASRRSTLKPRAAPPLPPKPNKLTESWSDTVTASYAQIGFGLYG
jgi:hypothetical protein